MCMRKNRCNYILICVFALFLAAASTASAQVNWDSYYVYTLGNGANIGLAEGVTATYTSAANTGDQIEFSDLNVNSAGATDFNISSTVDLRINSLTPNTQFIYTVTGSGTQTFSSPQPTYVLINDTLRAEGDGWTYTDGHVTVTGSTSYVAMSYTSTPPPPQPNPRILNISNAAFAALALAAIIPIVVMAGMILAVTRGAQFEISTIIIVISFTCALSIGCYVISSLI